MTVIELIRVLSEYPGDMQVFIAERKTEFAYGLVNEVYKKDISFHEDEHAAIDEDAPMETVLVIDEC